MKIHDKSRLLIAGLCALLLLLSGCKKETAAPAAPPQAPPPEVGIMVVQPQAVRLTSELAAGTALVLAAEPVPNTDKLLKLQVDCGEKRQIVAGIAKFYQPADVVGKTIVMVANLQPATLCGVESQGMLLAAKRGKELRLLGVDGDIAPGAKVG